MSVEYVRPEWDDFEGWFDDHYEWEEVYPEKTAERTVHLPLPVDDKVIRIYTTVNKGGDGRDKGDDAIRTLVWDTEENVPVGGREYTKRIRTDDDPVRFLYNMHKKVCWLYDNWRIFDREMRCDECAHTMRGAESEHGEFLFCTNEDCDNTVGLPNKECPECHAGMVKGESEHGEFFWCTNDDCDHTEDA